MVEAEDPARVAAQIAPIIDRLRNAVSGLVLARSAELTSAAGVPEEAIRTVAMLRNRMPDRPVTRDQVVTVMRYVPVPQVDAGIARALDAGLLHGAAHGELRLADRGRTAVEQLYRLMSDIVGGLWAGHDARVATLLDLTARALDAAARSAGPAFAVMHPPYEPPAAPPAVVLAERLTPLRFHRFDAHVAAWEAAGLTVEEVVALPPGPERDRIEDDTNRRAAAPYAALDPRERQQLLDDLGRLPREAGAGGSGRASTTPSSAMPTT
jgi:hypothetical protein